MHSFSHLPSSTFNSLELEASLQNQVIHLGVLSAALYLSCVLGCELWNALLTDDEGSANPTAVAGNVDTVVLSVNTDKLANQAGPPELAYGPNKQQRHSVYSQNLAIQEDDAKAPAECQNSILEVG